MPFFTQSLPNLLITDVIMPGMNGRTLAERVAATLPGIQVLFASGHASDVIAEHGILEDGIEFIAKPYSAQQLALRARDLLERRQLLAPRPR